METPLPTSKIETTTTKKETKETKETKELPAETLPIIRPRTETREDAEHVMQAVEWFGKADIRVVFRPRPLITDPWDAIIRITSTTICGSDLHLYHNEFSGMQKGDVLGHEFMGIVEAVGGEVKELSVGDRVVVSSVIACGRCRYCREQLYSCCDATNPSREMEEAYGQRIAGIFGYSHLFGGYAGGQAEYARVPLADVNCLKIPLDLPDEKVLFLSDIVCTGWHGNELANVQAGQTVAIWGCGPVGLMTGMWARFRGVGRLIMIDAVDYRLRMARDQLAAEIVDFSRQDVLKALKQMGPIDACIDCVGFRGAKSLAHRLQRALRLETDTPEVLSECIHAGRKAGSIGIIGDYYLQSNNFPIGPFMEKSMVMRGGQVLVQKYWKELLGYIREGRVDPTFVITHTMSLGQADLAYKMFDNHEENCVKIILKPAPTSL